MSSGGSRNSSGRVDVGSSFDMLCGRGERKGEARKTGSWQIASVHSRVI